MLAGCTYERSHPLLAVGRVVLASLLGIAGAGASMLTCRVIDDPGKLDEISLAWDHLARRSEFIDIYATAGFARAWWKAYGRVRTLRLILVEDASGPRLIAPFYFDNTAPHAWKLIGNFRADYNNLIFAAGDLEPLSYLFSWLRTHGEWRLLMLQHVPGHAAVIHHFPTAYEGHWPRVRKLQSWLALGSLLVYRGRHAVHPRIAGTGLNALGNLLQSRHYRKHVNWLSRQATLEYRSVSDPDEIRSRLPEFMALHVAEWRSKGRDSLFTDPDNRTFYELLTREMAPYGATRLDLLTLGGRPIAAHFGFSWRRRVYYYKPCYDPSVATHSPGKLLLAYIIRRAIEEGAEEVDLLYGREAYKDAYASDIRQTGSLLIHRSRVSALMERVARLQLDAWRGGAGAKRGPQAIGARGR